MILSLFLRGKKCYVATEDSAMYLECDEIQNISDDFVPLIKEIIKKNNSIKKLIFPLGPGSFTSMRVIDSIVKGFIITNEYITLRAISSFFIYNAILLREINSGTIAIATRQESFYCMDFIGTKLFNYRIANIISKKDNVFFDSDQIFDSINLAKVQLENSEKNECV